MRCFEVFFDQISSIRSKLDFGLEERLRLMNTQTNDLENRLNVVEKDFLSQKGVYIEEMSAKISLVAKDILVLQHELKEMKTSSFLTEDSLAQRSAEISGKCESMARKESEILNQRLNSVRVSVLDYKKIRDEGDSRFQSFVLEEVANLKNSLVVESGSREQADEDIVSALNHYTKALQESLRMINS